MSELRVISLGWGVQSFTLAALVALGELPPVDFAIHADTTWERQHTYTFAAKWTPWLEERGVKVVTVQPSERLRNPGYQVRKGSVFLPVFTQEGRFPRQCTSEWKVLPIRRYLRSQGAKHVEMLIGISKDEWTRAKDADVQWITNCWPLLDLGMTRADCVAYLERHQLEVPHKSACCFCPFMTVREWAELKRQNGRDWQQAVEVDAAIRDKRPPYPLYVHRKCKPLPEAVDIPEDHGMTQPGLFELECGSGYCFL